MSRFVNHFLFAAIPFCVCYVFALGRQTACAFGAVWLLCDYQPSGGRCRPCGCCVTTSHPGGAADRVAAV